MKLSPSSEDYLEAILLLSKDGRVARVKDIAERLGVTKSSVVARVRYLKERGLVAHERYGYLELTNEGERLAKEVLKRHNFLFHFFHEVLGIDRNISDLDACKVEHQLSKRTLRAFMVFLDTIEREFDMKRLKKLLRKKLQNTKMEGGNL